MTRRINAFMCVCVCAVCCVLCACVCVCVCVCVYALVLVFQHQRDRMLSLTERWISTVQIARYVRDDAAAAAKCLSMFTLLAFCLFFAAAGFTTSPASSAASTATITALGSTAATATT